MRPVAAEDGGAPLRTRTTGTDYGLDDVGCLQRRNLTCKRMGIELR